MSTSPRKSWMAKIFPRTSELTRLERENKINSPTLKRWWRAKKRLSILQEAVIKKERLFKQRGVLHQQLSHYFTEQNTPGLLVAEKDTGRIKPLIDILIDEGAHAVSQHDATNGKSPAVNQEIFFPRTGTKAGNCTITIHGKTYFVYFKIERDKYTTLCKEVPQLRSIPVHARREVMDVIISGEIPEKVARAYYTASARDPLRAYRKKHHRRPTSDENGKY